MTDFFSELITRNNFWHIPLILIFWGGFLSFSIWWINAVTRFIEVKMKERYGTIWWPIITWKSLHRFFSKPKKWKWGQKVVVILLLLIFLLQHFGYDSTTGTSFYDGCEKVNRVLTLQAVLERLHQKAQASKKKPWWETPIKVLLNVAKVAGTVKKGADAVNTIRDAKDSI